MLLFCNNYHAQWQMSMHAMQYLRHLHVFLQISARIKVNLEHPAQSGQTVRLTVWPWQQVCVMPVRNGGGASIMNIHYDVTGLLTVVWRSHSGQIVWPAGVGQGRGGFWTHSTYTDIKESAGSRQLDRWRWLRVTALYLPKTLIFIMCLSHVNISDHQSQILVN